MAAQEGCFPSPSENDPKETVELEGAVVREHRYGKNFLIEEASQNMLYSLRRRMIWRRGLVKLRKRLIQLLSFLPDHPAVTILLLPTRKVRFNKTILLIHV